MVKVVALQLDNLPRYQTPVHMWLPARQDPCCYLRTCSGSRPQILTLCLPVAASKLATVPRNQASSSGHSTRSSRPTKAAGLTASVSTLQWRSQVFM